MEKLLKPRSDRLSGPRWPPAPANVSASNLLRGAARDPIDAHCSQLNMFAGPKTECRLSLVSRLLLTGFVYVAVVAFGGESPTRVFAEERNSTAGDRIAPRTSLPESSAEGGSSRREVLIASLTIFVLAVFVGFEVITKVPPTLHTPLMSGSNAISGITIVGALLAAGSAFGASSLIGFCAVVLATINAVGGFMVTGRMLAMFQSKRD